MIISSVILTVIPLGRQPMNFIAVSGFYVDGHPIARIAVFPLEDSGENITSENHIQFLLGLIPADFISENTIVALKVYKTPSIIHLFAHALCVKLVEQNIGVELMESGEFFTDSELKELDALMQEFIKWLTGECGDAIDSGSLSEGLL